MTPSYIIKLTALPSEGYLLTMWSKGQCYCQLWSIS